MQELVSELKKVFGGTIRFDASTLDAYSTDYSIFSVRPQLVVTPKNVDDIKQLVKFVADKKKIYPTLSITARAAGTDMSGGPLNHSIIMDMKMLSGVLSVDTERREAVVLPGTYYRDFEKACAEHGLIMPVFPASKDLCMVGGMVANNGAGEKSLKYGQNKDFVKKLKVILSDGQEYEIMPVDEAGRQQLMLRHDALGKLARVTWQLLQEHRDNIIAAQPKTSKNASGYLIWDVWNRETGIFDLTKLFVGAQGTTGFITEITYGLVPVETESVLLVTFVKDIELIPQLVTELKKSDLETLEMYDDHTFKFAVKFFPDFLKKRGPIAALRFAIGFLPEIWMTLRGGVPKFIFLSEFVGNDRVALMREANDALERISGIPVKNRVITNPRERDKYFEIRHESFKLLTDHSKKLRTAPFIDDVIVDPKHFPEYLPQLTALLDKYGLMYTIVGHIGNGNLHVIPLMNFNDPKTKEVIMELSPKVYDLVARYDGSLTAEHNDGIVRTPYLSRIFNSGMIEIFNEIKVTADPLRIFNPGKKVQGTEADMEAAIHIKS